ncbi:MarR family winged helix-turn-helix transcriptional regulator [Tomitella fengzijianii]|uniref:MarR family transcriptional regulator n=1 Tax=Tomitella fengzijianii TaxID=2597660 RepID=A0A516X0D6_9ACTN|nr:MarR family transcriptional regulator [Tomitella fengzijianii]QDQ96518.1 MarR family transcriptional regulator [Tomitella fengzijianii]
MPDSPHDQNATAVADPTTSDARSLRVWRDMLFAHSIIVQELGEELAEQAGLTLAQYDVLLRLRDSADGAMRMGELAEGVLVTTSGLTRVVDKLESAGLVERVRLSTDRRGVRVSLTGAGRDRLRDAARVHREGIRRHFTRHITDDELPALESFFSRLFTEARGMPAVESLPMPAMPPRC